MKKPKTLRPVQPSAGIRIDYQRRLRKLVEKMHESVMYWLSAAYRADTPHLARDASPATELQAAVRRLARRWIRNWNDAAPKLAKWFLLSVQQRSDQTLHRILKDHGFSVQFKMTPEMQDASTAVVKANVSLIKSIPQKYFGQIEQIVMRSVMTGRDLQQATRDLQQQFGVARRRAELIARDQNNKAHSALQHIRQLQLGMTEGIWIHSGGGREPRPEHVKMDGKRYKLAEGMWDPFEHKYVQPGELINCRCVHKAVIPGL